MTHTEEAAGHGVPASRREGNNVAKTKAKQNTKKSEKEKNQTQKESKQGASPVGRTTDKQSDLRSLEDLPLAELRGLLNSRQIKFVEELEKGGTMTEAAIRAGYAKKTAASQASALLKNPTVAAYRRARAIDQYRRLGITQEWVGLKLIEVLDRCMAAVPHLTWDSDAHEWVEDGTWNFDAKGALQALGKIGDSMGMFRQEKKQEQTGGKSIEEFLAGLENSSRKF